MLTKLGFEEINKGKTSGSRVKFERNFGKENILIHKPHPRKELKRVYVKQLLEELIELGEIK